MPQPSTQTYDYTKEQAKAMRVAEQYFDTDITTADAAYDVLVDNGVHPDLAQAFAQDMFPSIYMFSST